jgi:MerR family transcriptional regulator, thiopeptide resistance regulator
VGRRAGQTFRIHEFAELAGVTVKALHHYDRLGLLKPARTDAGYRVYTAAHLARLEQVIALKALGLSLKDIRSILDREPLPLRTTFRQQRNVLEEKRRALDRAIDALEEAERAIDRDPAGEAQILQHVIRVMSMQDIDAMRKYYSDDAWEQWKHYYDDWPSEEWRTLYREIDGALDDDPAGERAQALADRYMTLAQRSPVGAVRTGMMRAWVDREHWPSVLKRRLAEFNIERATEFVNDALWIRWDREREERARKGEVPPRASPSRRALFHQWKDLLGTDPSGPAAQVLAARWRALMDEETGGDEEMKADLKRTFRSRQAWPRGLKRYFASLYETDLDTWDQVTDFIEQATRG